MLLGPPKFVFRITSIRVYYFESHCVPTTLKSLYLDFASCVYQYNKLEINAPALEYLCFCGYVIEHVLLGNLSNLVEAVIEVDYDEIKDYGNMIMDFIKQLSNVKSLHLDSDLTQVRKKKHILFHVLLLNG